MSVFEILKTTQAPEALGPYSQATVTERFVFLSGQIGLEPISGQLVSADVEEQLEQIFMNMRAILESGGLSFKNIIKLTAYLLDLDDFSKLNKVMMQHFTAPFPARATVEVSGLPKNAAIEIEAIAIR